MDSLFERSAPGVPEIFIALQALVREVMPDASEQLDVPDRLVAFGFGPPGGVRMPGLAVALIPHAAHVNVQLADGAALADPSGIVEGTGKRIRHVKCRTLEDVTRPQLRALLEEQARLRRPGGR
ncbi:MAG: DUF1801 domain-containing protein [Chloroflexota bacterium]|nr:DUF1801 domain-containing protein [Chloroflexota bacterium]